MGGVFVLLLHGWRVCSLVTWVGVVVFLLRWVACLFSCYMGWRGCFLVAMGSVLIVLLLHGLAWLFSCCVGWRDCSLVT